MDQEEKGQGQFLPAYEVKSMDFRFKLEWKEKTPEVQEFCEAAISVFHMASQGLLQREPIHKVIGESKTTGNRKFIFVGHIDPKTGFLEVGIGLEKLPTDKSDERKIIGPGNRTIIGFGELPAKKNNRTKKLF